MSLSYNNAAEFTVQSTIRDDELETLFFIYMVDKVLSDCMQEAHARNILANILGIIREDARIVGEFYQAFGHYQRVPYLSAPKVFENTLELRSKDRKGGRHLYIWSSFSPKKVSNVDGKYAVTTLLYTSDLYSRLMAEDRAFLDRVMMALFYEYGQIGLPNATTITVAPTNVVNVVSKMAELADEHGLN